MAKVESERLKTAFEYEAKHLGLCVDNTDGGKWEYDAWKITLNGFEIDYKTGLGLRETTSRKDYKTSLRITRPRAPKVDDIIYSLFMDLQCSQGTFEDFCADCGYNTDSRKALQIYLACQENGKKLLKLGVNIADVERAFENY